jgi:chemotaxis protein methyltransferase CheR
VEQVPQELLVHFFQPAAGGFAQDPGLRAAATFEQHDLLRGPMRSGWQLIACRNVAIYLEEPAQSLLYQRLSAALAVGGLLWLGSAEYLPPYASLQLERLAPHLYRRLPAVSS